jgi:hypothetical protein
VLGDVDWRGSGKIGNFTAHGGVKRKCIRHGMDLQDQLTRVAQLEDEACRWCGGPLLVRRRNEATMVRLSVLWTTRTAIWGNGSIGLQGLRLVSDEMLRVFAGSWRRRRHVPS